MICVYQAWELFQRKISEIQRGLVERFPKNHSHPPPRPPKSRSWTAASWNCTPMHSFFTSSQTFTSSSTNPASSGTRPPLSHWRVCHHLGLFSNYKIENIKKHCNVYKQTLSFKCPAGFSRLQLDQSSYCLPTPTSIFWHCHSHLTFHYSWRLEQQKQWIFHFQNF